MAARQALKKDENYKIGQLSCDDQFKYWVKNMCKCNPQCHPLARLKDRCFEGMPAPTKEQEQLVSTNQGLVKELAYFEIVKRFRETEAADNEGTQARAQSGKRGRRNTPNTTQEHLGNPT